MTVVALAHKTSATGRPALLRAVEEARMRGAELAVLHVVGSLDADRAEAYRLGISDEIDKAVAGGVEVPWQLHLRTATTEDAIDDAVLALLDEVDAELVVIGARRRSPLGKALLGSTAQTLILQAQVPVLVVKS